MNARHLALVLPLVGACGGDQREVLAHYASGGLETESEEVLVDGAWVRHGPFTAWHEDGTRKAVGGFFEGEQDGDWTQWYANGVQGSRGAWVRGAKDGPWAYWHENGAQLATGSYRETRAGPWVMWRADGSVEARGSFLFGAKEGLWVHRREDGSADAELSGVYEAGAKVAEMIVDGRTTEWYDDDRPRDRNEFEDGVRHGRSTSWYPSGSMRYEGTYARGRKSGRWTYWTIDGRVDDDRSGVYDGWRKVTD
jgi:antitoxin component YwqK of YwqJK toxin-antitoxin module